MDSTAEKIIQLQRSGVIRADADLCMTCRECEVACSLSHDGECNPGLSRIHIEYDDFRPGPPTIVVCKQCDWPACYYACAAKWGEPAIHIDPQSGARYIDPSLCRGCGTCLKACPLTPENEETSPPVIGYKPVGRKRVYLKCDLCIARPEGPACVQICPGQALTFVPAEGRR
jgi:carbon-monoxide dehydrogenase iron sulfur subunit